MTLTLDQHRAALSAASSAETAAVRAYLAAWDQIGTPRAELDQRQAHLQAKRAELDTTRAAFDAAFTADDLRRRMIRARRALEAADRAELDGPLLEAFQDQAADAYARWATIAGHAG